MNGYLIFTVALVLTLGLTVLSERFLIPILKSVKMEQKILDIGPRWHKSKEGTPTMGGLGFIFAGTLVFIGLGIFYALTGNEFPIKIIVTYGFALVCGAIGFIDDYAKFFKKQNEGLKAWSKYLLQLCASGLYLFFMRTYCSLDTTLVFPYFNKSVDLGVVYYVFALILLTGIINSVNLTDGIDGLAGSVTAIVGGFFAVASFALSNEGGMLLSAIMIGCCIGFLVYNFYPARVFMGDTGSLFLGGFAVGMAFLINNPLIILLAGLVYVCESFSVILQVASFKLTGKRIFKMSPIHHHFEKCGWNEVKIVCVFSLFTLIFCIISYFGVGI